MADILAAEIVNGVTIITRFVDQGDGTFARKGAAQAGLPTSTGQKTAANSTSVVLASDQGTITTSSTAAGTTTDAVYTDATGATAASSNSLFKGMFVKLEALRALLAATLSVKAESSTPGAATSISVTTSATLIKAAGTRKRITITNDNSIVLYISTTNTVTATNAATKGLAIAANGGGITVNWQTDIYGIYASGSNYVTYVEET